MFLKGIEQDGSIPFLVNKTTLIYCCVNFKTIRQFFFLKKKPDI